MSDRAPVASAALPDTRAGSAAVLPARNRRTALVLVAWIILLMLASGVVAWLRN